jgi:putative transcription factor
MADEWDTVTKIGSKVRPGGGSAAKEKVIRSEAQLNAARRQGADIATEKKFGGTNSVCSELFECFFSHFERVEDGGERG